MRRVWWLAWLVVLSACTEVPQGSGAPPSDVAAHADGAPGDGGPGTDGCPQTGCDGPADADSGGEHPDGDLSDVRGPDSGDGAPLSQDGDATVDGDATGDGDATVDGNATGDGDGAVIGDATGDGDATVDGDGAVDAVDSDDGGEADADPGPCLGDSDCDDSSLCTLDLCLDGECAHTFVPCDDGSVCTLDGCDPLAGCFVIPELCDDGDPCTVDGCSEATSLCNHAPAACDDGDPCTADLCTPGAGCVHSPSFCCLTHAQCVDDDPCTVDTCVTGSCVYTPSQALECCTPAVWSASFDDGEAAGWQMEGDGAAGWSVVPPFGPAGSPVLWFGDPETGGFDVGTSSGAATSPPFLVPAGAATAATLRLFFDAEPGVLADHLTVHAVTAAGAVLLWTKSALPSTQSWHEIAISLSAFGGQAIQLRLRFDTVDAGFNDGLGVLVDWIEVATTCAPAPCVSVLACNDGHATTTDLCINGACMHLAPALCLPGVPCDDNDPCTADSCQDGFCAHAPTKGCCLTPSSCSDGDPCTDDLCAGGPPGTCANPPSFDCCLKGGGCADGDPCTVDTCPPDGGRCSHAVLPGCCADTSDCLDDDPCTDDRCSAGLCVHVIACCDGTADCEDGDPCTGGGCDGGSCSFDYTGAPGCCAPLLTTDFPQSEALFPLWDSDPASGVGWTWTAEGCHSPGGCIRAMNPETDTYDGGLIDVAVATAPFVVQSGTTVSLWVRVENEWTAGYTDGPHHDVLSVLVVTDESQQTLWSSDAPITPYWDAGPQGEMLGPKWFHLIRLPITGLNGQTARVALRFVTLDSLFNALPGPWVDDLLIDACVH